MTTKTLFIDLRTRGGQRTKTELVGVGQSGQRALQRIAGAAQPASAGLLAVSRAGAATRGAVRSLSGQIGGLIAAYAGLSGLRRSVQLFADFDEGLIAVPKLDTGYHNELDRSQWGLIEARVYSYRGYVFACWDAETPDFESYLGDLRFYLDDYCELPDGTYGEWEAFGGIMKWKMPCNWKFGAENFSGDYYHNPSHASVDQVILSPAGSKGRHTYDDVTRAQEAWKLNICITPQGHTARGQLFKDDYDYLPTYQEMAVVEDYFRDCYAQRRAKLGEKARWFGHGGTIFPNVSYSNGVQSMGTWHPSGPHQTETWRIFLAPKAAPDEVKDVLRHYVIRYQGPSGLTEQDDMENWGSSHEGARGTIARRYDFHYGMGMGYEQKAWPATWLGGEVYATEDVSEQNQRAYYARWAADMDIPPNIDRIDPAKTAEAAE